MIQSLNPYLAFDGNASEALDFYKQTLGAEVPELMRWGDMPGQDVPAEIAGNVMHATLTFGEVSINLSDLPPGKARSGGNAVMLLLNVTDTADVDRLCEGLAAGGGQVTMPPEDTFWNARYAECTDRYGVQWKMNCQKEG